MVHIMYDGALFLLIIQSLCVVATAPVYIDAFFAGAVGPLEGDLLGIVCINAHLFKLYNVHKCQFKLLYMLIIYNIADMSKILSISGAPKYRAVKCLIDSNVLMHSNSFLPLN